MSLIKNILNKDFASLKDYTEERIASIVAGKIISKKDEFLNKVRGLGEKMNSEDDDEDDKKEPDGDESGEDTDKDGDGEKSEKEKKDKKDKKNKFPFKKKEDKE